MSRVADAAGRRTSTQGARRPHRHGLTTVAVVFCIALLVALVSGCGRQPTVLQQDQAKYPAAVALYQNGCITCHGNNLQGGIGPDLRHVGSTMSLSAIVRQIERGGGAMPAYALPHNAILTPAQIRTLAVWLSTKH